MITIIILTTSASVPGVFNCDVIVQDNAAEDTKYIN